MCVCVESIENVSAVNRRKYICLSVCLFTLEIERRFIPNVCTASVSGWEN